MIESEMTRRGIFQAGLVVGLLPLGAGAGATTMARPKAGIKAPRLHKLLVDRSIPQSVRLAAQAREFAEEVYEFDGDLTRLWNDELRRQWPNGPKPIGGLTAPGARFVLEQFGRDHDARVVFSAEHRKVSGGFYHRLVGDDTLVQSANLNGGVDWVTEMARLIMACPHQPTSNTTSAEYASGAGVGMSGDQHRLVTWILAPITSPNQQSNSETAS